MKKINHVRLFSHALRTVLLFLASFFIYETLKKLEKKWNENNPENEWTHFYQRKLYKGLFIFIVDLLILYGIFVFLGIHH